MKIRSSSLALRFYARDGWTLELLQSLVTEGKIVKHPHFDMDEKSGFGGYFTPEPGTKMNVTELMKHTTSVIRAFDDHPEETDKEFIQRMLW